MVSNILIYIIFSHLDNTHWWFKEWGMFVYFHNRYWPMIHILSLSSHAYIMIMGTQFFWIIFYWSEIQAYFTYPVAFKTICIVKMLIFKIWKRQKIMNMKNKFEYIIIHIILLVLCCCKYCKIFKIMINLYDQIDIVVCYDCIWTWTYIYTSLLWISMWFVNVILLKNVCI